MSLRGAPPGGATKQSPFTTYLHLLLKWNKAHNLTAITDPGEIKIKHFEDSLAPLPFLPTPCRLLDIGCGAGFPGIPLKIKRPDLEVVLLDSRRKKTAFCEAVIRKLDLEEITAVQGRAEDATVQTKLGRFDAVISRAAFSIAEFLKIARPYLKKDGVAIAMKSRRWPEEKTILGNWKLKTVFDYELSNDLGRRSLLIF
ncbi:MAG: 16S rRNA (guanine(527)-N(7))-methyltransferase RsmG [Deltaproteobacteria bacterium]|nr:16S rRNA (guanine(527)-N(7))-methyltransferase RsmG [Deltaproteobacteria bacterium]MBI4223927.1 16S rRNA (guanine(527)-N(7))-methyltransferase RsmG [Deltaproteobacteria bacterium]